MSLPACPALYPHPRAPLRPGEGWRRVVRDEPVLERVGQVMREPHITPELFQVKGAASSPERRSAAAQLRGARSPAGHGQLRQ